MTPTPGTLRLRVITAAALMLLVCPPARARPDDGRDGCERQRVEAARLAARLPGAPAGAFDPATGRNLLNYPPDRVADAIHMRLSLDIPDMNTPRLTGEERLTIEPIGAPLREYTLDARLLEIADVRADGADTTLGYSHDGRKLRLSFNPPVPVGRRFDLVTNYTVNDPPFGLTWTPESPEWPGRPAQLHSQGQPETNSYWFPCHDSPNERLTTELIVTVPKGYVVSSNGRFLGKKAGARSPARAASGTPPESASQPAVERETFHWRLDEPHVNYLVSLVVGKFDVVDLAAPGAKEGRLAADPATAKPFPMPVYVPPGRGGDVWRTYGRTPEMIELFSKITGQPYPWPRYAQLVVWNFGAGGMENTGATTLYDTAIFTKDSALDNDLDGLISHELAHQWFGDLITGKSWEHIWLNEGFATYFSALWAEKRDGHDAYLANILGNFDGVIAKDKPDAMNQPAMVSKQWTDAWEPFRREANPYGKGSSILHMLRRKLGDEVFFRAIGVYVDRYKFQAAETADFRRVLEEVSGESMEEFFEQWCTRPGVPDLLVKGTWDSSSGELTIGVEQRQRIDGANPAFVFDLPVTVFLRPVRGTSGTSDDGAVAGVSRDLSSIGTVGAVDAVIRVEGRQASLKLVLDHRVPAAIVVDPELTVLAAVKVEQPEGAPSPANAWTYAFRLAPTFASKARALRALRDLAGPPISEMARTPAESDSTVAAPAAELAARVAADRSTPPALQSEAIDTLKALKQWKPLIESVPAAVIDRHEPRIKLAEALGEIGAGITDDDARGRIAATLESLATADPAERVRAAAVRGLGKMKAADRLRLVLDAAEQESQNDRLRQSAIESLADLDAPEGLGVALRYSLPGAFNRTRPTAIAAAAKLAHHDPETSYRVLASLLTDRERRSWQAAGEALVALKDPRGVEALEQLASSLRNPADQRRAREWKASLEAALRPPPAAIKPEDRKE